MFEREALQTIAPRLQRAVYLLQRGECNDALVQEFEELSTIASLAAEVERHPEDPPGYVGRALVPGIPDASIREDVAVYVTTFAASGRPCLDAFAGLDGELEAFCRLNIVVTDNVHIANDEVIIVPRFASALADAGIVHMTDRRVGEAYICKLSTKARQAWEATL